jgi:hypothetical protein
VRGPLHGVAHDVHLKAGVEQLPSPAPYSRRDSPSTGSRQECGPDLRRDGDRLGDGLVAVDEAVQSPSTTVSSMAAVSTQVGRRSQVWRPSRCTPSPIDTSARPPERLAGRLRAWAERQRCEKCWRVGESRTRARRPRRLSEVIEPAAHGAEQPGPFQRPARCQAELAWNSRCSSVGRHRRGRASSSSRSRRSGICAHCRETKAQCCCQSGMRDVVRSGKGPVGHQVTSRSTTCAVRGSQSAVPPPSQSRYRSSPSTGSLRRRGAAPARVPVPPSDGRSGRSRAGWSAARPSGWRAPHPGGHQQEVAVPRGHCSPGSEECRAALQHPDELVVRDDPGASSAPAGYSATPGALGRARVAGSDKKSPRPDMACAETEGRLIPGTTTSQEAV